MNKLIFAIVVLLALGAILIYAFPDVAKVAGFDTRVELPESTEDVSTAESSITKVSKTPEEWKGLLTPMQYDVTREHGTERPFTGELWDNKKDGTYTCVCCDLPLFPSDTKYKSGTGWPSFYDTIKSGNVGSQEDRSMFALRTEVHCNRCDAHLGHVFNDGPNPTGLRYCINSASLKFIDEPGDGAGQSADQKPAESDSNEDPSQ